MPDTYEYQSIWTGAQIDNAIEIVLNGKNNFSQFPALNIDELNQLRADVDYITLMEGL